MVYLDQHFLTNNSYLEQISNSISTTSYDTIVEIGPGKGALTSFLVKKPHKEIILIEKDKDLIKDLKLKFSSSKIKIEYKNALDFKIERTMKIFGNIPYAITEPLYNKLIESDIEEAVLLHGKDFYKTITQRKNSKWYYLVSAFYEIIHLGDVSGENFEPSTKVSSSIVCLKKKHNLTQQEQFWQEFFHKMSRTTKNTILFSLVDSFNYSKKQAKQLLEKYPREFYDKKATQLSNEEFQELVLILEKENLL